MPFLTTAAQSWPFTTITKHTSCLKQIWLPQSQLKTLCRSRLWSDWGTDPLFRQLHKIILAQTANEGGGEMRPTSATTGRNMYFVILCRFYDDWIMPQVKSRHGCLSCFSGTPPQSPVAWTVLGQSRDERQTMENKGQVGAARGVREWAVDSRADMTQNQSSVSGQTNQPLSEP